ncbi:MAG: EF-hand domain-containing protein [Proteobacteria bacterium]|nr:EF-hand domain-containing protein [Pseudomonadota bacterium]
MKLARKPLFGMIALGAALAMPVAFAQEADATAQEPTTTTQDPTAAPQAEPATAGQQLTWADLDVDGNGTLSKQEASNVNSLAQVFDEADADQNGELSPDEYKAFVAKANEQQPGASGGLD